MLRVSVYGIMLFYFTVRFFLRTMANSFNHCQIDSLALLNVFQIEQRQIFSTCLILILFWFEFYIFWTHFPSFFCFDFKNRSAFLSHLISFSFTSSCNALLSIPFLLFWFVIIKQHISYQRVLIIFRLELLPLTHTRFSSNLITFHHSVRQNKILSTHTLFLLHNKFVA